MLCYNEWLEEPLSGGLRGPSFYFIRGSVAYVDLVWNRNIDYHVSHVGYQFNLWTNSTDVKKNYCIWFLTLAFSLQGWNSTYFEEIIQYQTRQHKSMSRKPARVKYVVIYTHSCQQHWFLNLRLHAGHGRSVLSMLTLLNHNATNTRSQTHDCIFHTLCDANFPFQTSYQMKSAF